MYKNTTAGLSLWWFCCSERILAVTCVPGLPSMSIEEVGLHLLSMRPIVDVKQARQPNPGNLLQQPILRLHHEIRSLSKTEVYSRSRLARPMAVERNML